MSELDLFRDFRGGVAAERERTAASFHPADTGDRGSTRARNEAPC